MNQRHVDAIAGRLSLRAPQRQALAVLDRLTTSVRLRKDGATTNDALAKVRAEFPAVTDFERDFPSVCFALATGVGKTRLMGAFVAYLHLAHGFNNFFVLAPNLTVYAKLIADFTPHMPKYVLKGIAEFAVSPPLITTGETYERQISSGGRLFPVSINIFNISKINAEVRGGQAPRIRSFREEIGESYFDHLARLDDLVLIMDESHRYRASAGIRVLNELNPVLGLELTATPFVETTRGPVSFRNVIFEYPLARAMADGFVKEPAVVTRENFVAAGKTPESIEQIKLEDGVRLHESVKAELETYARQTGQQIIKPFVLVIARDTAHASDLMRLIGSDAFFDGRYAGKVIQVDSSVREDETVERLLKVEQANEPTEIVIHVNMLKEGWDVTNLYTIIPLRAANARTLIEQSIGRGLRLPYGRRTGVAAVDRLNIVAHDRFQEIVDEAKRPGSMIRLHQVVLGEDSVRQRPMTMVSEPHLVAKLGLHPDGDAGGFDEAPALFVGEEQKVAHIAWHVISGFESRPSLLPGVEHLRKSTFQAVLLREVATRYRSPTMEPGDAATEPDLAAVVARICDLVVEQTIDIPRILVVPKGEVQTRYRLFELDLSGLRYDAPSELLWATHLRTGQVDRIGAAGIAGGEGSLVDELVSGLIAFDDIAYDMHCDLLYALAGQVRRHLLASHTENEARRVFRLNRDDIVRLVHAQMHLHVRHDGAVIQEEVVTRGFTALRASAFTVPAGEVPLDFRLAPPDKSNMARYLFCGFERCLYPLQKFHSEAERKLAIILEREALRWFKPVSGQFQLFYRSGPRDLEYQPDFVAAFDDQILMIEPKAADRMNDADVLAKRDVAVDWCRRASLRATSHGGKPWVYLLIPHDAIFENMTMEGLVRRHIMEAS